jgi:cysteine-S-conjugate beta-lyase
MRDQTRTVIPPEASTEGFASLSVPTYRASTILFSDAESYSARGQRGLDGYSYGLHGTPTSRTLEAQLTELEGGARTVLVPSGQSAITVVMLTVLMPGDTVLIPDTVYPPVTGFCANYLKPRGINHRTYDPMAGGRLADLIDETTRLVWVESPGSTTMEVQDIPAIVAAAHAKGAYVGCDNTWATPLLFKPLAHGVDFSMHALSKYAGGHSDLLLGSVTVSDLELRKRLRDTMRMLGLGVSPDDASLVLRGLQTMGVRLAHVGKVSLDMAKRLAARPDMGEVLHPALPNCPGHEYWARDFAGCSGLFSVVLPAGAETHLGDALSKLKIFAIGSSFGGTRSLIAPMSVKAHRALPEKPHEGTILRISIGLEDPEDIWADLVTLFDALREPQEMAHAS